MTHVDDAYAWIEQARSDARMAEYVSRAGVAVHPGDMGCHVALLCAQSFEKCIKGCMYLVGQTPTLTHGVEVAIDSILRQAGQRRSGDALRGLSDIFRARGVRVTVRQLLDWTPGNADPDDPNYEYPWRAESTRDFEVPYGHDLFDGDTEEWARVAKRLAEEAAKIVAAIQHS